MSVHTLGTDMSVFSFNDEKSKLQNNKQKVSNAITSEKQEIFSWILVLKIDLDFPIEKIYFNFNVWVWLILIFFSN